MRVTVRLMGPYKRAAGVSDDVALAPSEPTLRGVLAALTSRFPEAGRRLQPTPGTIEPAVRVVVNDVVVQGAMVGTEVQDGDRIAFVPIVGGGDQASQISDAPPPQSLRELTAICLGFRELSIRPAPR